MLCTGIGKHLKNLVYQDSELATEEKNLFVEAIKLGYGLADDKQKQKRNKIINMRILDCDIVIRTAHAYKIKIV